MQEVYLLAISWRSSRRTKAIKLLFKEKKKKVDLLPQYLPQHPEPVLFAQQIFNNLLKLKKKNKIKSAIWSAWDNWQHVPEGWGFHFWNNPGQVAPRKLFSLPARTRRPATVCRHKEDIIQSGQKMDNLCPGVPGDNSVSSTSAFICISIPDTTKLWDPHSLHDWLPAPRWQLGCGLLPPDHSAHCACLLRPWPSAWSDFQSTRKQPSHPLGRVN